MHIRPFSLLAIPAAVLIAAGCEVQQQEEAEAPDIQVEEGQLPEYEVEPGTLDVERDTAQVQVPDIDVETSTDGSN